MIYADPTAQSETKTCYACGRQLPVVEFRVRRRGSPARMGRCRACHARYMRGYRLARRTRTLHRFAAELRQEANVIRAIALCGEMVARFGGAPGFAAAWYEAIESARRDKPGSRLVLNSHQALLRLVQACDANRPEPEVMRMSEEELQEPRG